MNPISLLRTSSQKKKKSSLNRHHASTGASHSADEPLEGDVAVPGAGRVGGRDQWHVGQHHPAVVQLVETRRGDVWEPLRGGRGRGREECQSAGQDRPVGGAGHTVGFHSRRR